MKKLVLFLLTLCLSLPFITVTGCGDEYADSSKDAVFTQEDVAVEVAYAFYRQGIQQNYSQTMSRRNINTSPEDATAQNMVFTDCSSFVNSIYYEAFGENIMPYETTQKAPQTLNFMNYAIENKNSKDVVGAWETADYKTDSERETLLNSIRQQLKPGDIINYRSATAGHSLIYVGNNQIIHSMGDDYEANYRTENSHEGTNENEKNGTVQLLSADDVFVKNLGRRYLFYSKNLRFCILRPIARGLTTTDESVNRMLAKGIDGEKTSSVGVNTAISTGENITYNLTITNHRDLAYKNIEVKDILDDNLTFVSGSKGVSNSGQTVTFNKEIKAGETITLSWTAKVKDTAPIGTVITSNKTTVNGVSQAVIVNTVSKYSSVELNQIANTAKEFASQNKKFIDPIDILKQLYSSENIFNYDTVCDMLSDIIDSENATLTTNPITKAIAPNLYGGQAITSLYRKNNDIVRLITTNNLSVGDIIIAENDVWYKDEVTPDRIVYIYIGDMQLVACSTKSNGIAQLKTMTNNQYESSHVLVSIFAYKRYAVIRPSQII